MKTPILTLLSIAAFACSTGCAVITAPSSAIVESSMKDREANSSMMRPDGPTLVEVKEYQFWPNATAMTELCRKALEAKVGKPVSKDQMRISHDRNNISGVSSCKASLL